MEVVFDTYAWIEYFNATNKGKVVENYLRDYEVFTPLVVLLELSYKADREGWDFEKISSFIKHKSIIVGIDENFVFSFGRFYNKVKKKVRKIGITDVIILHTAKLRNTKVLTGDPHFSEMKESIML